MQVNEQSFSQPSPRSVLPSSQSSPFSTTPLPQLSAPPPPLPAPPAPPAPPPPPVEVEVLPLLEDASVFSSPLQPMNDAVAGSPSPIAVAMSTSEVDCLPKR